MISTRTPNPVAVFFIRVRQERFDMDRREADCMAREAGFGVMTLQQMPTDSARRKRQGKDFSLEARGAVEPS